MASRAIAIRRRPSRVVRVYRSARKSNKRIPLAVVAGFIPLVTNLYSDAKYHGLPDALKTAGFNLTGYGTVPWSGDQNPRFSFSQMRFGGLPILAGFAVHYIASKTGINRAIARSGIPFISI